MTSDDANRHDMYAPTSTTTAGVRTAPFAISVEHPRLICTDAESVRTFLRKYDQYVSELTSRARQLNKCTNVSEPVRAVELKFCVDVDFIESSITLGFVENATSYEKLTDEQLRTFLEGRVQESKDVVTLDTLDKIVKNRLHTDMRNTNAKTRIQDLFASYNTILRNNGLLWIIEDNQKVAVSHVLSAVRPANLKERLESDLEFSHHPLRKDFKGFLQHAVRVAEAYQLVDCGPPQRRDRGNNRNKSRSGNKANNNDTVNTISKKKTTPQSDKTPLCLWPPHTAQGIRHYLKHCPDCPENEKRRLLREHHGELAKTGPARSTRSQLPTTGRLLTRAVSVSDSPSCPIEVSDGIASLSGTGRCDDGCDESIVSPTLAQTAVCKGIGKFKAIAPVHIQVAIKSDSEPSTFTFSRIWQVPRLILELASGRLALRNISFLVADSELAAEDLLIGLPVLKHLGIDSKTLLERNRATLDGTDCDLVRPRQDVSTCGTLGRLLIARLQRVKGPEPIAEDNSETENATGTARQKPSDPERPCENFFAHKLEHDPFPNPNLMDLDALNGYRENVAGMLKHAYDNGLPDEHHGTLAKLVEDFNGMFGTSFSSTPSKVDALRIKLTADARPIRVRLRNYSPSQRTFMKKFVDELLRYNLVYANPSSAWACAPLLVPKPGPAEWRFTVDLTPVNKLTIPHSFPMPVIKHELLKTSGSCVYASVDFTHSYWQLPLHESSQECQSFITPDGVYTPTRVLHGTTNAVLHLLSFLSTKLPHDLRARVLLWVDDCLFHATSTKDLLQDLRTFFQFCAEHNWTLNPKKCVLFSRSAKWCGRIISADGIRHDPANLDGLTNLACPTMGSQLQTFVCAMQWLRSRDTELPRPRPPTT